MLNSLIGANYKVRTEQPIKLCKIQETSILSVPRRGKINKQKWSHLSDNFTRCLKKIIKYPALPNCMQCASADYEQPFSTTVYYVDLKRCENVHIIIKNRRKNLPSILPKEYRVAISHEN